MNTQSFYKELSPFKDFGLLTNDDHFRPFPEDWNVVITDIRGSTKAIAEGRYKEVNSMGAASIVVARKALGSLDFPFVFGGDGATLLVHDSNLEGVCEKLNGLKHLGKSNYNLDLRVGVVPLKEISPRGEVILCGKFELTQGRSIAILKGGGLTTAEALIKGNEKYLLPAADPSEVDLGGLSCRWQPIPSKRGKILTILVTSRDGKIHFDRFLDFLDKLLPEGLEGANPTNTDEAQYRSFWKLVQDEKKLHSGLSFKYFLRVAEIALAVLLFKFGFQNLSKKITDYSASMRTHSDFRKFDDLLRMVIDCSHEDIDKIRSYLEEEFSAGKVFYGLHEADSSLMTCFVEGLGQGEHIHFVDAENGGYTAAAVQLKSQMKTAAAV